METYNLVQNLNGSGKTFFTTQDLALLGAFSKRRNLENTVKKLIDGRVLVPLERGKYYVSIKAPTVLEIAQFIYSPSYISFETALNYHGVLAQFPIEITCVTTKKGLQKTISQKVYSYIHIKKELFEGFEKVGEALIALPEKALVDQVYLSLKGLKSINNLDEYNFEKIDKAKVGEFIQLLPVDYQAKAKKILKGHYADK